jgi:hypothetical protein
MNKYERMLAPGETIIHAGRLHYIILIKACLWFISLACLALYIPNLFWNSGKPELLLGLDYLLTTIQNFDPEWHIINDISETLILGSSLSLAILSVALFIYYIKIYFSRYVLVSDNRLIYKTGLFFIHIMEIEIDEIEEIHMNSGVLGSLLNYAYIYVDMRFVGDAYIPCVPKPYLFMQAMHKAHDNKNDSF